MVKVQIDIPDKLNRTLELYLIDNKPNNKRKIILEALKIFLKEE